MTSLYGRQLIEDYGDRPNKAWLEALSSMTPREAALGYKACKASGDNWSPKLPLFIKRVSDALKSQAPQRYPGGQDTTDPKLQSYAQQSRAIAAGVLPEPDTSRMERLKKAKHAGQAAVQEMQSSLLNKGAKRR